MRKGLGLRNHAPNYTTSEFCICDSRTEPIGSPYTWSDKGRYAPPFCLSSLPSITHLSAGLLSYPSCLSTHPAPLLPPNLSFLSIRQVPLHFPSFCESVHFRGRWMIGTL